MKHYWQDVFGWFEPQDAEIYKQMVENASDGAHFVEVGSFVGRSSSFMAVEIMNSGKTIKFDCVDTWKGSLVHQEGQASEYFAVVDGTLFEEFEENMSPVYEFYQPIRMTSVEAAKLYSDKSLDFVYIDADHEYEAIKADITAWLPKVKIGGIIAGHDYPAWEGVVRAVEELDGAGQWPGTCSWFLKVS